MNPLLSNQKLQVCYAFSPVDVIRRKRCVRGSHIDRGCAPICLRLDVTIRKGRYSRPNIQFSSLLPPRNEETQNIAFGSTPLLCPRICTPSRWVGSTLDASVIIPTQKRA